MIGNCKISGYKVDIMDKEILGKKILQNCRNELYLDFPYLDGAFASLDYEADTQIDRKSVV